MEKLEEIAKLCCDGEMRNGIVAVVEHLLLSFIVEKIRQK